MPLDSQSERIIEELDGLDDAVGSAGDMTRPWSQEADSLVVEAVDLDVRGAENAPEEAILLHLDRMSQVIARQAIGGGMVHAAGVLILDILVDGAAQGYIDQLDAPANAENGEVRLAGQIE